jgi:hypothetical protein
MTALNSTPFTYNFTTSSAQAIGGIQALFQEGSVWKMRAGNFDGNAVININDINIFKINNGRTVAVPAP